MHTEGNKQRKAYEKPSYEAEEILEKMSLACKNKGLSCKAAVVDGCDVTSNPALT